MYRWLILVIIIIAFFFNIPKLPINNAVNNYLSLYPLKFGLDLQGGMQLILQTQMDKIKLEDRDSALESSRDVIERRVNLFGVSEALVQSSRVGEKRRILVELPGIKDASAAANLVGKTAQLEFKEIEGDLPTSASGSAYLAAIFNAKPTDLTGADLKKAQVVYTGRSAGPVVQLEFNEIGAKKFAEITKRNVGKILPIFLDEQPVTWPTVNQEIVGGPAIIEGQFSREEAKNLSIQLNAGALPVPIKILEQRLIGPALGSESVRLSFLAGVIGLITVMIYMAFYYGTLGLIANITLLIYALITLAIFRTGIFILPPITLTLAGIAGFVLSIGMAVDANILIFERMKEEIRWGKSKTKALELGFERAWSSIWASNVSSLITAGILYYFGTSLIRGFALTLSIGVLVSMFTSYIVTRTILRIFIK